MIVHIKLGRIRATWYTAGRYWLLRGAQTIDLGECDTPEALLAALQAAADTHNLRGDAGAGYITSPDQLPD